MRSFATAVLGAAALAFAASGALAQDKGKMEKKADASEVTMSRKDITENDKVKVYEVTYKPGQGNNAVAASTTRVVRAMQGGQLQRIYKDGKTETLEWKTGQVRVVEPGPAYSTKNVGKTTVQLYVVQLK